MGFVRTNNGVLRCELRPASPAARGPALLLLNALGTTTVIWDEMLAHLAFPGAVLRFDQRGHGLSELGQAPYSIPALADDALGACDAFGLESVVACGLSVGGLVAQELTARAPERVRALILCGTASRIGTREGWQARLEQVQSGGIAAIADSILGRWFAPGFGTREPDLLSGYRCLLERTHVPGYLATLHALRDTDLTEQTRRLRLPSLVVSGELDQATTPEDGQRLAACIPGARFELLKGAAHLLPVEKPRELASSIDAFLKELRLG